MESFEEQESLEKAEEFLSELQGDQRTAPAEFLPVIETYAPRLEDSIRRFRERRISGRELDAHAIQIRLSYARDLSRLLAQEPAPTSRWVRPD